MRGIFHVHLHFNIRDRNLFLKEQLNKKKMHIQSFPFSRDGVTVGTTTTCFLFLFVLFNSCDKGNVKKSCRNNIWTPN